EAFRASLAAKPRSWTWVELAALFFYEDDEQATACLREALKLEPDYEEAHYNLGCCLARLQDLPLAEHHFRRAIAIDPEYAPAFAELGRLLSRRRRLR